MLTDAVGDYLRTSIRSAKLKQVRRTVCEVHGNGFAALAERDLAIRERLMSDYSKTFEWIEFPHGSIRYVGERRGRDDPPIDVFAVAGRDRVHYGEARKSFLIDGNNYNLEIVSFGWRDEDWRGTEPDPRSCVAFTREELERVQSLFCNAVPVWRSLEDKPFILRESGQSNFMGDIVFREGWALIKDDEDAGY